MMKRMLECLQEIYGEQAQQILDEICSRFGSRCEGNASAGVSQKDAMLITYGDTLLREGEKPLQTLKNFLQEKVGDALSAVHLLPICPYSSDDGFSVIDYRQVNKDLGGWEDVQALGEHYDLMLDAVINHASRHSEWFQGYLRCEKPYDSFFITCDPDADYSKVTRPRALPLLTRVETAQGPRMVWTTFSEDQIDLNFRSPQLLMEILDVLLGYAQKGARFIRLDAIGFAWKEENSTCMNLPQTHALVKLIRAFLDRYAPGTVIITETNVPSAENLAYLGNGSDEAGLVYQFPLPPLTLHAFLTGNASYLTKWAAQLPVPNGEATFFNFLASHDGIGVRPVEGILPDEEVQRMIDAVKAHGGLVSTRDAGNGKQCVYELNVTYMDALTALEDSNDVRADRFLGAHTVLMSLAGVPGIYVHSLLGSRNAVKDAQESGINRRINRAHLQVDALKDELETDPLRHKVFGEMLRRLRIRAQQAAFHPKAEQEILTLDPRVFAVLRKAGEQQILALINVSADEVEISCEGYDLLSENKVNGRLKLMPYQCAWILKEH